MFLLKYEVKVKSLNKIFHELTFIYLIVQAINAHFLFFI